MEKFVQIFNALSLLQEGQFVFNEPEYMRPQGQYSLGKLISGVRRTKDCFPFGVSTEDKVMTVLPLVGDYDCFNRPFCVWDDSSLGARDALKTIGMSIERQRGLKDSARLHILNDFNKGFLDQGLGQENIKMTGEGLLNRLMRARDEKDDDRLDVLLVDNLPERLMSLSDKDALNLMELLLNGSENRVIVVGSVPTLSFLKLAVKDDQAAFNLLMAGVERSLVGPSNLLIPGLAEYLLFEEKSGKTRLNGAVSGLRYYGWLYSEDFRPEVELGDQRQMSLIEIAQPDEGNFKLELPNNMGEI